MAAVAAWRAQPRFRTAVWSPRACWRWSRTRVSESGQGPPDPHAKRLHAGCPGRSCTAGGRSPRRSAASAAVDDPDRVDADPGDDADDLDGRAGDGRGGREGRRAAVRGRCGGRQGPARRARPRRRSVVRSILVPFRWLSRGTSVPAGDERTMEGLGGRDERLDLGEPGGAAPARAHCSAPTPTANVRTSARRASSSVATASGVSWPCLPQPPRRARPEAVAGADRVDHLDLGRAHVGLGDRVAGERPRSRRRSPPRAGRPWPGSGRRSAAGATPG